MQALPIRRPGECLLDPAGRHTLVVEPAMAGMMVLLPEERLLDSHERDDGKIELTIGARVPRRQAAWPWIALALAGTTLGGLLAQALTLLRHV